MLEPEKDSQTSKTYQISVTVKGDLSVQKPKVKSANGLTYIDNILIVNKTYSLPSNYNPGVDPKAQEALDEMFNDAEIDGINLYVISGFRSYSS